MNTNEDIIIAKLDALKELFNERFKYNDRFHASMENHLKQLNGQVAKNSSFRLRAVGFIAVLGILLPIAVTYLLNRIV